MNLTATAENGCARIELKGTISEWREAEAEFTSRIKQLIRSGVGDIHIYINSPGGECFETNEIADVIKRFPGKITGGGGALVASAAIYIAINCTSFSMSANGLFMTHQVSGGACGRVADIEPALEVVRKLNEYYLSAFLSRCTDKKRIRDAWKKGDYRMNAQEAKKNDFVTEAAGKAKIDKTMAQMITSRGYAGETEITNSINNERSENDMDLVMLTTCFGMDASTTGAQFIAQVDARKRKADCAGMLERQEEARKEQGIENILNSAIREKRIAVNVRDDWGANLTNSFDTVKRLLDAIRPVEMSEVHAPSLIDTTNKKFEDLQNDPEALKNVMERNPAEYECLLNDYIKRDGK